MKNFLDIEDHCSYEESVVSIIPLPYEATTSYMPGTKNGPLAIIKASEFVELYDEELDCEPYLKGIHTQKSVKFSGEQSEDFKNITEAFIKTLKDEKFAIGLGGEHSISFPIYKAFHEFFSDLSVLQFDAHSDLRETYHENPYSHACVMKRIYELNPDIVQIGIRSQEMAESKLIKEKNINTYFAFQLKKDGLKSDIVNNLKKNVFITFDVDYFDPAIIPSTGTPEPGGFFWDETIEFLKEVFRKRNVAGLDMVELSPIKGLIHPDFTVAKLIYKMIGFKLYLEQEGV